MDLSALDIDVQRLFRLNAQRTDPADALRCIESKSRLSAIADSLVWFDSDCAVKGSFIDLASDVVKTSATEVGHYLAGASDLASLLPVILDRSLGPRKEIDRSTCLRDLKRMEELVDDIIIRHLRSLRPRGLWRILGFGGGDCYYERSIGERLTGPSNGDGFRLYRFDPHEKLPTGDVTDVDLGEHAQAGSPVFDIVVCRWALHHVPGASRWDTIANAIRMLHPAGALVIVEEGDFAWRAERAPLNRAYQLLVACEDVLVNGILRPGFADTARRHDDSGFYLDYLARDDIVCIEHYLPRQMRRYLYLPGSPDKHGEVVIIYS